MWLKFSIAFPSLPFPHHHVLLSWGSSTWVLSTDRNADGYPTTCLCFPGNDSRGGTFLCLPHVCAHTLHTLFFFKGSYSICCFFIHLQSCKIWAGLVLVNPRCSTTSPGTGTRPHLPFRPTCWWLLVFLSPLRLHLQLQSHSIAWFNSSLRKPCIKTHNFQ